MMPTGRRGAGARRPGRGWALGIGLVVSLSVSVVGAQTPPGVTVSVTLDPGQ
jgi:hypothetical protein